MEIITTPIQWEITESQNQKKEKAYFLSKASGFIFIFIFIMLSSLGFLLVGIIMLGIIYFIKKDDILKSSKNLSSSTSSKYKISENGVEVFNVTDKKQSTYYLWENILSFYAFSETGPVGYVSSSFLGDDFVIVDKQKNQIILKTNKIDSSAVKMALLKKIKKKAPSQSENIFFSITSKNLTLTKHANLNLTTAPVTPQFRNKTPQEKNIAEKNFYKQQREYKRGIQKQKDILKRNILFFIYILLMFLITIIYLIKN